MTGAPADPRSGRPPRTWKLWSAQDVRVILIGTGILIAAVGGLVLLNDIPPAQYPSIIVWLIAVLLAHDVLVAGIVFAVAFAGRRAEGRLPLRSILVVQGSLAVGGIMVLLVVPEIVKKAAGTANPSILPLAYGFNLALLLACLALAASGALVLHVLLDRQRRAG